MQPLVRQAGARLLAADVSIAFILDDGTKVAAHAWRSLKRQRLTPVEFAALVRRFTGIDVGLAIVAGLASGNLEIIDFDTLDLIGPWTDMVEALVPGLLSQLVMVQTPRPGRHVYYRCQVIAGNQKLAQTRRPDGKPKALIETRGIGGYAIIPPSPPACHPLHKPYEVIQGDLCAIPTISPDERDILLNASRTFHSYVNTARIVANPSRPSIGLPGDRPGDLFAAAVSWQALLEPEGWTCVGHQGDHLLWRRPGKSKGWSASSGLGAHDLLYVFSSNADPFEADMLYSKFGAFAVLHHQGDFSQAARQLALMGYRRSRYTATA